VFPAFTNDDISEDMTIQEKKMAWRTHALTRITADAVMHQMA